MATLAALIISFLLGSIPTAYILVRTLYHQDIREVGSGNVGAMNVRKQLGWKAALAVFVIDAAKGVCAVWICQTLNTDPNMGLAVAVTGHIYPPWLRFRGGKGIATAGGGMVVTGQWLAMAVFVILWLLSYLLFKRNRGDLANLIGALGMAAYGWYVLTGGIILMALVVALKHWQVLRENRRVYKE